MEGQDGTARASGVKLTYQDFLGFPDDGQRHELIDGEHYVAPSPATRHQRVSRELLVALHLYLERAGLGEVFAAPFDVVLSNYDIVEPDLLVVLTDQREIVTELHVQGAPAIVVEILSPGTRRRDLKLKRVLYERVGVREYWLVDPQADAVTVCSRRADGTLAAGRPLRRVHEDTLTSTLLPGFGLALARLFGAGRTAR